MVVILQLIGNECAELDDHRGEEMTKDELFAFICEDAGLDRDKVTEDTLLFSDGFIDSFTMTSLIAFIEDETGITIEQSAVTLENFDSVSRIMAFVDGQGGN